MGRAYPIPRHHSRRKRRLASLPYSIISISDLQVSPKLIRCFSHTLRGETFLRLYQWITSQKRLGLEVVPPDEGFIL